MFDSIDRDAGLPHEDLRQAIDREIRPPETIVWLGQPGLRIPGLVHVVMVIGGLYGVWFMVHWISGAAGIREPFSAAPDLSGWTAFGTAFSLLGLPGLAISVALVFSPLWAPWRLRLAARRTAYAITDRRAIVFDGALVRGQKGLFASAMIPFSRCGVHVQSFLPDQLQDIRRITRRDGSGDLILQTIADEHGSESDATHFGFFFIPRVAQIEQLLKTLAASAAPNIPAPDSAEENGNGAGESHQRHTGPG